MYVAIDRQFLEKNKEKAAQEYNKELESGDGFLWPSLKEEITSLEIQDDGTISLGVDTDLCFVSIEIPISDENLIRFVEVITKKMNKFKNIIESLKK